MSVLRTAPVLVVVACMAAAGTVRADVIDLTNGRHWEGTITSESADAVVIQTFGGPVTVARSDIADITRGPTRQQLYQERRAETSDDDLAAQLSLARWCREQDLDREADYHYALALGLEPANAEAHKALGHTLVDGHWLTHEELMRSRGLVQYKGRWVEPGEAARARREDMRGRLEQDWRRRIERLLLRMKSDRSDVRSPAMAEFLAIEDPMAAPALYDLLDSRDAGTRRLAMTVIERQAFRGSTEALVKLTVGSDDAEVRRLARSALGKTGGEQAYEMLLHALGNGEEDQRRRAALALGELGDRRAVPALIESIRQTVMVSGAGTTGGTVGGRSYVRDYKAVVAPGAVGYDPEVRIAGFRRRPQLQVKTITNNEAVIALELITGLDYGDDQAAWRAWWDKEATDFLHGSGREPTTSAAGVGTPRAGDVKEER